MINIFLVSTWSKSIGSGHVKRLEAFSLFLNKFDVSCNLFFSFNSPSLLPITLNLPPKTVCLNFDSIFLTLLQADNGSTIAIFDMHETELLEYKQQINSLNVFKSLICDFIPEKSLLTLFDIFISGSIVSTDASVDNFFYGLQYFIMPYDYIFSYQRRESNLCQIKCSRDVFLSVGGTDHNDITSLIINYFLPLQDKYNVGR